MRFPVLFIALLSGALLAVNVHLGPQRRFLQSRVEVVRVENFRMSIVSPGVVEPEVSVSVKNDAGGNVAGKMVKEGDAVLPGQKLMQFSLVDAQIELGRRKSQLFDAQKEFEKAEGDYKVNRELYRQHAIPRKDLVDARQALNKARGTADLATKDYEGQMRKVAQSEVASPIAGVVLADKVGTSGWVGSGQELFVIGQLDRLRVRARVDELDINKIRPGLPAEIHLEAFPGVVFPGVVENLGAQAQQGAFAEIDVLVGIADLKGMPVKPNLSAKVNFEAGTIPGALTLPVNCVQYEGSSNFVNVITPDGSLLRRAVELGGSSEGRIVVLDGLGAGETVLVPDDNAAALS
jgi:RND family efflux transporter MFP subunit